MEVTVSVRRYRKDPRAAAERRADESVLRRFERGELLGVDPIVEREAVDHVQRRYQARRETVASLGTELGVLRRAHGLTQDQIAVALGTKKSNISRLESGQYGGLTIEYFLAARTRRSGIVSAKKAPPSLTRARVGTAR